MALTQEQKKETSANYRRHEKDTGSPEVQASLLSRRINELTQHLKSNPKDFACRRGLLMLVGKRRRLLNYYRDNRTPEEYKNLITSLNIRK